VSRTKRTAIRIRVAGLIVLSIAAACGSDSKATGSKPTQPVVTTTLSTTNTRVGSGVTTGPTTTLDHFSQVIKLATDYDRKGSINEFWATNFKNTWPRLTYEPPSKVVSYRRGELPNSKCVTGTDPKKYYSNAFA
jgi:hypothetical protein